MQRRRLGAGWRTVQVVVGVLVVLWSLAPLYWGLVVSLSTPESIRIYPVSILPAAISGGNFARLLDGSATSGAFLVAAGNSVIQAVGSTVLTLLLALPAAYAFARLRFRFAGALLAMITLTLAVPIYLVLIPLFQYATAIGQVNTQQAVIVVLASASLPLAIWILRSHIVSLPADLESAARVDGAGTATVLTRIIAPLVAPGLVAAAVVVFLASWGAFLIPLVYGGSADVQPLTVLIPTFASKFSSDLGLQAAAGLLAVLPPVALVIALQRHLLSGLLKGASR
jgi:multiple sugar transport system permease protein